MDTKSPVLQNLVYVGFLLRIVSCKIELENPMCTVMCLDSYSGSLVSLFLVDTVIIQMFFFSIYLDSECVYINH